MEFNKGISKEANKENKNKGESANILGSSNT